MADFFDTGKMKTEELLQTIQKALSLKKPVTLEDSAETLEPWDSLGQLAILVAIDKATEGKAASIKNLANCQSIRSLAETLQKNGLLKN